MLFTWGFGWDRRMAVHKHACINMRVRARTHTKELKLLETLTSRVYCTYLGQCGKWVTENTDTGFLLPGVINTTPVVPKCCSPDGKRGCSNMFLFKLSTV